MICTFDRACPMPAQTWPDGTSMCAYHHQWAASTISVCGSSLSEISKGRSESYRDTYPRAAYNQALKAKRAYRRAEAITTAKHGAYLYRLGCRCSICRRVRSEENGRYRARKKKQA